MLVMLYVKSFMFLLMGMFTLYSGFDNKIYFEFYLKKCFSECNGGMFNFALESETVKLNNKINSLQDEKRNLQG